MKHYWYLNICRIRKVERLPVLSCIHQDYWNFLYNKRVEWGPKIQIVWKEPGFQGDCCWSIPICCLCEVMHCLWQQVFYSISNQIQNISPDGLPFYFTDKANTWSNGASSACQRLEYQKQIADSLVFPSLVLPCQVGGRAFSRVLVGLLFWFWFYAFNAC